LSGIKKLAGQTLWYGLPTIASRFLGYLMNMALPFFIELPEKTADLVQVYTLIPFLNVIFAYGMETAYFRFSQQTERDKLYNTLFISLFSSTLLFSAVLWLMQPWIVSAADLTAHPEYVWWMIAIIATDNLNTLPFARLRQENRPKKYAFVRISGILINLTLVIFFLGFAPKIAASPNNNWLSSWYDPNFGLGYYLVGNFVGSALTMLLLFGEWKNVKLKFSFSLWKEVMKYSSPLIIVGLGGMVNDVLSRMIYRHVVDLPMDQANHELGVFANIFRLALLVTIMIQAFRMAAEPFFFNRSKDEDAKKTYARIMKFFVIACCFLFLFISLFLDVFRWIFIHLANERWAEGLEVVPLLTMGNIFLGIYYNLSIWYKLTNKNSYGAIITLLGAAITIGLNIWLIPMLHYTGAALATAICYFFMMIASYKWGKKHYPIPYSIKKLTSYLVLSVLLYLAHFALRTWIPQFWFSMATACFFLYLFTRLVLKVEEQELMKLPLLKKWYAKKEISKN
jgi:O-antigen/teichoic acid export membrane protein